MSYAIRYGGRDYPLLEGRLLIGRSEECHFCLDDPMASRNHAVLQVKQAQVRIEDLNSRNGVYVNDERVRTARDLSHGDQIRIGAQVMVVVHRSVSGRAETLVNRPVTARLQAFGVLGGLADKALGMGRGDEVERILGRQLDAVLERSLEGKGSSDAERLSDEEFDKAVRYSFGIARLQKDANWVAYLFRLHGACVKLMDGDLVNELYALAPKLRGSARAALRDYLVVLSEPSKAYAPGQRFVMKRLEGLEQALP